ncbi:MAG: hypothetical protein ACLFNU_00805 [Bacteroidales bacterium]
MDTQFNSNPIIHIGYNKTATTWFQQNLFPFVRNCHYVKPKIINKELIYKDHYLFEKQKTRDFFESLSNKRLLISSEDFCLTARSNPFFKVGILKRVKETFPDAHMIVFIRNQLDRLLSLWLFYIKNSGGTYSFEKFIANKISRKYGGHSDISLNNLRYHYFLNSMVEIFGRENVSIYLYEEFASSNLQFTSLFCERHNFEVDLEKINFSKANEGLRKHLVPLYRFTNLFTKPKILHRNFALNIPGFDKLISKKLYVLNNFKLMGKKVSPKDFANKKTLDYIADYYKESNSILVKQFGLPLKKFGYPLE